MASIHFRQPDSDLAGTTQSTVVLIVAEMGSSEMMTPNTGAPRSRSEEIQNLRLCLKQAREALQNMQILDEWQDAPKEIQRIHKDVQDDIVALDMYLHSLEQL